MKGFYFDLIALPRSVYWVRGLLLLLGASVLSCVAAYRQFVLYPQLTQQRVQMQAELAELGTPAAVATMNPKDLAQAWQRARDVSLQLGLPWQNFFVQLAVAANSGDVGFISIEPDSQKGHVVLVAEARSLEAMLQFVSALQGSSDFSAVVLQSHTINKNVPEKPVRFRVSTTWRTTE
jgi:Tfp pilus assembly protein PilN